MNIKKSYFIVLAAAFAIGLGSCATENEKPPVIDPNQELLVGLTEIQGQDHTYNYDFNILKVREKREYYKPISLAEGLTRVPTKMREKLHPFSNPNSELPFSVAQTGSNIVTSWNDKNKLVFQIQIAYFENDKGYETNFKDFFIVSATQYPENPFFEKELDDFGENLPYQKLILTEDLPLYYKPRSIMWPRMFDYYYYSESESYMYKESTGAAQYYAWYNGLIFKIGYNMTIEEDKAEAMVRKFILGK